MASLKDIIKILRENKAMLKQNYSVTKLGLFGSYVRGDNSENSDIDILSDSKTIDAVVRNLEIIGEAAND